MLVGLLTRSSLRRVDCVCVKYNPFGDLKSYQPDDDRVFNNSNGSLIAVSYEARACGVKRCALMRAPSIFFWYDPNHFRYDRFDSKATLLAQSKR